MLVESVEGKLLEFGCGLGVGDRLLRIGRCCLTASLGVYAAPRPYPNSKQDPDHK